jgi:hypothetical protein
MSHGALAGENCCETPVRVEPDEMRHDVAATSQAPRGKPTKFGRAMWTRYVKNRSTNAKGSVFACNVRRATVDGTTARRSSSNAENACIARARIEHSASRKARWKEGRCAGG